MRIFQLVLFVITAGNFDGRVRATLKLARGAVIGPAIVLVGAVSGIGPLEAWWAVALVYEFILYYVMDVSGFVLSPHHFSERHGLIFIIALGEAVISIGIGASGLGIGSEVVIPAVIGLGIIVAMWWTYFDVTSLAAELHVKTAASGNSQIKLASHVYMYFHLPMIIGAIFCSLGVKKTLAHTDETLAIVPAVALCGGLILFLIGLLGMRLRCCGKIGWPRVVAVLALGALICVSQEIDALVLLSAVAIVFVVLVAYETLVERHHRHRIRSDESATWANQVPVTVEE